MLRTDGLVPVSALLEVQQMIEEMMMPLHRHFDSGFHGMGVAFKEGAENLSSVQDEGMALSNGHLPVNFLYRHSVELFLKSMIVTVHRKLRLPTGTGSHTPYPQVKDGTKWRELTQTHSVKVLLCEFDRLVAENKAGLAQLDAGDWTSSPELQGWIDTIETYDDRSTFSRYPCENSPHEEIKSGFVNVDAATFFLENSARQEGQLGRLMLGLKDDNGFIVESFGQQEVPLSDFRDALAKASFFLYGCSCGIHAEVVDGMGTKTKRWNADAAAQRST